MDTASLKFKVEFDPALIRASPGANNALAASPLSDLSTQSTSSFEPTSGSVSLAVGPPAFTPTVADPARPYSHDLLSDLSCFPDISVASSSAAHLHHQRETDFSLEPSSDLSGNAGISSASSSAAAAAGVPSVAEPGLSDELTLLADRQYGEVMARVAKLQSQLDEQNLEQARVKTKSY